MGERWVLFRLILFVFLIVALALAVSAVTLMLRSFGATSQAATQGDKLPSSIRTVAYILLLVLMFGVVTGWLGAA